MARRIERTLEPVSVWVAAADEPVLVKVQNVQHLATPIRAQLARPAARRWSWPGCCIPTPAVGGEPREVAEPLIPALEGLDRGWYAGAVGWTDLAEDGEFCVGAALRAAARARSPTCTPATGSWATRYPPRSWPRPRPSSRRCCRCWRERAHPVWGKGVCS